MFTSVEVGIAITVVHCSLSILLAHARNPRRPKLGAVVVALVHRNQSLLQDSVMVTAL